MCEKMDPSNVAPTLEYTCSVCTCGRELSTLYYRITVEEQFRAFAETVGLDEKDVRIMNFTTLKEVQGSSQGLSFCCLKSLRYGIRASIACAPDGEEKSTAKRGELPQPSLNSYKYPEGLPGPLSKEKTLTWC